MSENRDNHGFSVLVAQEIGVNRAIMLQHFKHLQIAFLDKEKSAKDVWVKRSRRALSETYPYFTEKEIRGCLDRLERDEYIRAKVDNALNYDRTKSYQLDKKGWDLMGDPASDKRANRKEKASDKRANGFDERADDNITKGPMNIGSCNSVVTSFVEGERTPPAPNPSTSKEEKKEKGLVAPWQEEWLEAGNEWLEAQKTPSPKVAPPPSPIPGFQQWQKCFHCAGTGNNLDGSICVACLGTGGPQKLEDYPFGFCTTCKGMRTVNGRNGPMECPVCEGTGLGTGRTESESPPTHIVTEINPADPKTKLVSGINLLPSPRAQTTIEAEHMIATWIKGEGIETVKSRFSIAKQRFDPDNAAAIAAHYCSVYTKNPANKERLLKDPVTHFSDGLFGYLKNEQAFGRNLLPGARMQPGASASASPQEKTLISNMRQL